MCVRLFPSVMFLKIYVKTFHMCILCVCVCVVCALPRPFVQHSTRRVKIREKGSEVLNLHPPPPHHPPQHIMV